jgi:hypothetical protein
MAPDLSSVDDFPSKHRDAQSKNDIMAFCEEQLDPKPDIIRKMSFPLVNGRRFSEDGLDGE